MWGRFRSKLGQRRLQILIAYPYQYRYCLHPHIFTTHSTMNTTATIKTFGGELLKLSHDSKVNGCKMDLNVFVPPMPPPRSQCSSSSLASPAPATTVLRRAFTSLCRQAWNRHCLPRHLATRPQHPRRGRLVGLWIGSRLLPQRHQGALQGQVQHVPVHLRGVARSAVAAVSSV